MVQNKTSRFCKQVYPDFAAPLTEPDARSCQYHNFNESAPSYLDLISKEVPHVFKVTSRFDVKPWMYITPNILFQSTSTNPSMGVSAELKEEINFVIKKAISTVNIREASEWVLWEFLGCYMRYSALQGREYLLDVILYEKTTGQLKRRRFKIVRPHAPSIILQNDTGEEAQAKRVNILVPLSNVGKRFNGFLDMFEKEVLKKHENAALTLIVYGSEAHSINLTLQRYQDQYPNTKFEVVQGRGTFTRGVALDLGMATLDDSDLAFFCDVDMTFNSTFLENCRSNTVQGERVFYPIVFKYYDMNYVYRFKRQPANIELKRSHGHWGSYAYGMACIFKSDYRSSGGFDSSISGWGGEDINLFERVVSVGIEIVRVPEPSLSHRYHEKTCSMSLTPHQFAMCISSRNEGLADKSQLAEYVYYLEDKYGIRDRQLSS